MAEYAWLHPIVALLAAPLLAGVINRTKAFFAGRRGQPLLQVYWDLVKLMRKGAVYSKTTTWIFRAGPPVTLAGLAVGLLTVPWGGLPAPLSFPGDMLLLAYLLGIGRFFTILAALDTGSSFEGMGASREAFFSALIEPVLLVSLAAMVRMTGRFSLTGLYGEVSFSLWTTWGPTLVLVALAMFVVLLAENARIPVDDPTTHLELTMIHEVMVLDHGGPDFAFVLYGASLKLWVIAALLTGLVVPVRTGNALVDGAVFLSGMFAVAAAIGVVESTMARLRLTSVPQMLAGAGAVATLAVLMTLR
jgi:formate hydrogenlyase subunit 4